MSESEQKPSAQARFLSPLRTEDLDGGRQWRLLEPLRYYSRVLDRVIEIPAGFVADSYSSPREALGSWVVRDIDRRPAFIHDKLYGERSCTRAQADAVLLEAMEVARVPWWRRQVIYAGVRVGGAFFWDDDDKPFQQQDPPGG